MRGYAHTQGEAWKRNRVAGSGKARARRQVVETTNMERKA